MSKNSVRRSTENYDVSYEHHRSSVEKSERDQPRSNSHSQMQRNSFDENGAFKILLEVKPQQSSSKQTQAIIDQV